MRRRRKPSVIGIIFAILLLSLAFMVIASELTITTASKELPWYSPAGGIQASVLFSDSITLSI